MSWKNQVFVKLNRTELDWLISEAQKNPEQHKDLLEHLHDVSGVLDNKKQPTVFDRLDELEFCPNAPLDGIASFSYSWHDPDGKAAGYEKLESKNLPNENGLAGGHQYSGVYHPDGLCENHRGDGGPGVCKYCGRTLF